MSNLSKIENMNPYLAALNSPKFLDKKKEEGVQLLADLISKATFTAGQKMAAKDLTMNSFAMWDEIKQYFPLIRAEEISLAFSNGVRGEYGEFYGLNIKTFYSWIKCYQMSENRAKALIAIKQAEMTDYKKYTKEQARKMYFEAVEKIAKEIKEGGKPQIPMPLKMFRTLWQEGYFTLSSQRREHFIEKALQAINEEKQKLAMATNKSEWIQSKALAALLESYMAGELTYQQDEIIKAKAAELFLIDYFQNNEFKAN